MRVNPGEGFGEPLLFPMSVSRARKTKSKRRLCDGTVALHRFQPNIFTQSLFQFSRRCVAAVV